MARLSLCLIAKNEEEVLDRCLSSFKDIADEIVFVDTGSIDKTVELAQKYTDRIFYFKWIDDFAAARNFSFSKARYEYIMWADLDDVLLPSERDKILALKSHLTKDVYLLAYDYAQNPNGTSACLLQRERIVKNNPSCIRWYYPIHEIIDLSRIPNMTAENHPEIIITHRRTGAGYSADLNRNVVMLEAALQKPEYNNDPRLTYYIGKELIHVVAFEDDRNKKINIYQKIIKYFKKFLNSKTAWCEDQTAAQFKLAKCYHEMALLTEKKAKWMDLAEEACFAAIKRDFRWVEPYYLLGMLAWDKQNWRAAIHWFEICRNLPKPDVLAPVEMEYYTWLPRLQLCVMYDKVGNLQKAYERNKEALELNPTHPMIIANDQMFRKVMQKPSVPASVSSPQSVKIGWLTAGVDLTIPQFRIRTYNINNQLQKEGRNSEIFTDPNKIGDYDVIIFDVAFSEQQYNVMVQAKNMGKRALVNVCEALFEFNNPWYVKSMEIADMTICCSEALKKLVGEKVPTAKLDCIEDAVEIDFNLNCSYEEKEELVAGWCGMGGGAVHVERLRPLFAKHGYKIITIHEHANADIKWDLNTWASELAKCDIAIAPTDHILQPCKSNNKLTTYMALGLPAITSPLHAYARHIRDGETGFVAETDEQWEKALIALKDVNLRKKIGQAGKTIARAYALPVITSYWKNRILEGVKAKIETSSNDKSVDIIIPTYKNVSYLCECLRSIKACTNHPHNVIVVNGGGVDETSAFIEKEFPEVICINTDKRLNFSEANNVGIKHSKAPYVCLMNDDIIVSQNWLAPMVEQIKGDVGLCNPLSNCDKNWLHQYDIFAGEVPLGPGTQSLEILPLVSARIVAKDRWGCIVSGCEEKSASPEQAYDIKSPSNKAYTRDWVPFFCTLVSREVIDRVGLLDEQYNTGSEDLDYCIRASKLGYKCAVNENSFVLHFGGVSRKAHEDQNFQKHQEEDKYNNNRIQVKYGKPLIVIQTGWAYESWTSENITKGGIGGSETAAARIAEEMIKLGVRVVVFGVNNEKGRIINGVEWWDNRYWQKFIDMNWIDVLLISRYTEFLDCNVRCGKVFLWVHDIFALGDRNAVKKYYDRLSGILCLSPWHVDFFAEYHGIPKDKIILFGNAIDLNRFGL